MKTILTGTSGFVHQNLSRYLESHNHQVHSLSLRNADWVTNFDSNSNAVIYLAGEAHDSGKTKKEWSYFGIWALLDK